jgi:hypothetical protein
LPPDGPVAYERWCDKRDGLLIAIATAEQAVAGLLCSKCGGRGRVQWRRCGRVCFQCKGDGWTAKGRRANGGA